MPFTPAHMIEVESFKWDAESFRLGYVDPMILNREAVASYFRSLGVPWPASWGIDPSAQVGGTEPPTTAPAQPAAAAPSAERMLRHANAEHIRTALRAVYDQWESRGDCPPNVKACRRPVQDILVSDGYYASGRQIGKIAGEAEFKARRPRPGRTRKAEGRSPAK
jgi:hypothetical protein